MLGRACFLWVTHNVCDEDRSKCVGPQHSNKSDSFREHDLLRCESSDNTVLQLTAIAYALVDDQDVLEIPKPYDKALYMLYWSS